MELIEIKYKDLKSLAKQMATNTGERINSVGMAQATLAFALKELLVKHGIVKADVEDDLQATFEALMANDVPAPSDAPKAAPAPKEVTLEEIKALAADMNEVMQIQPPLNIEADNLKELVTTCAKSEGMIRMDDPLKPESWATLRAMGLIAPLDDPKAKGKGKGPATTKVKEAKVKPVKDPATLYTRAAAAVDALRLGTVKTYGELVTESNRLYMLVHPSKDNVSEARFAMGYVKQVLAASGIATFVGKGDDAAVNLISKLPARPADLPSVDGLGAPAATSAPATEETAPASTEEAAPVA